ncbi:sigma-70 family RNA polymerase sigma factor [Brevundimonas sp. BR2-1]|uniref:RNA polymerase sigma factor n=1 Tax=Brevundimonas sp. BR2-1 TaxID=3031123 RepID=UPI0030B40FD0
MFAAHESWLLGSLRRSYGAEVAEDLLQDTYLRLLRQRVPPEIRKPKAFFLQVARNLFLDGYRKNLRRAEVDSFSLVSQAGAERSSQVEVLVLKQIVLGMPQKLRDVFVLSRFGGMTNEAIAERLGIRPKTVEGRMTQALAYCAAQLRD